LTITKTHAWMVQALGILRGRGPESRMVTKARTEQDQRTWTWVNQTQTAVWTWS